MSDSRTPKDIGRELEAFFRSKNLSQEQVAKKFGVKQSWIARIYAGNFTQRSKVAKSMCTTAGLPFDQMTLDEQGVQERKLEGILAEVWEGTQEDADFLIEALQLLKKIKKRESGPRRTP